jgi:uncharacterized protein
VPVKPTISDRGAAPAGAPGISLDGIERRSIPVVELRADEPGEGEAPKITGYASVFNKLSEPIMGLFRERVEPGAFAPVLSRNPDVRALFNHSPDYVLGRSKAGTLRMEEDQKGLKVEIDPPDTQFARDLMVSIRRGDISGMSIGFTVKSDQWDGLDSEGKKLPTRTVLEFGDLYDVSVVTNPAFPATTVSARSLVDGMTALAECDGLTADDLARARAAVGAIEARVAAPAAEPEPEGAPAAVDESWKIAAAHRRRHLELMRLR